MARKRDTGEPTEYTPQDETDLTQRLTDAGGEDQDVIEGADTLVVDADVEWNGASRGHRRVRLDGLDLSGVGDALRGGRGRHIGNRLQSYSAKSWDAQLRALGRTAAGRAALGRELHITDRTRQRWASGQHSPSSANRAAIQRAYEARATDQRALRRSGYVDPSAVAGALTEALRDRYGAEIRLRDIRDLWLE